MKLFVKVKPSARQESIKKISETNFVVAVKEPPRQGLANEAVITALSDYLGVSRQRIKIIIGERSKLKIIEII